LLAIQSASTAGGASVADLLARFAGRGETRDQAPAQGGGEIAASLQSILDSLALDGHVYCASGKYMPL
jgi:hypothetical protein